MLRSSEISKGWRLSCPNWLAPPGYLAFGKYEWLSVKVPGHVHHDLVRAGVIADPLTQLHELGCQWVDESVWIYETEFEFAALSALPQRVLRFEGLDTVCIVHLNGAEIAHHDNMFLPLEVDVTTALRLGSNTLRVTFLPALREAQTRRIAYFEQQALRTDLVRFEERAFVRKAPYMFGWDWGPRLISAGIWKPVRLLEFRARIDGVEVQQVHDASGSVRLRCSTQVTGVGVVVHCLNAPSRFSIMLEDAAEIVLEHPELWWPRGLGKQCLYTLDSYLVPNGLSENLRALSAVQLAAHALDHRTTRIGLRRVQLVRERDTWGESFRVVVNDVPVWCVGANWIPDHSFPSQVTRDHLSEQLDRVVDMTVPVSLRRPFRSRRHLRC